MISLPSITGRVMKQIIVVLLTLSLIGCGSNEKRNKPSEQINLAQKAEQDKKYELEQSVYFYNLADENQKKQNYEFACQYARTSLNHANNSGNSNAISIATNNLNSFCNASTPQSSVGSTQAQQQSNIAGAMLGRWYNQEKVQMEGGYFEMKAVDNYLANGEESSQQQVIIGIDSYELACIVNQSIEWSASGNTLYEKILNVTVAPDWIKFNGQVVNDNKKLMGYCNALKEKISTHLFTTESIVIKYIDNEKKVQESVRSNGEIERNTHYRTTNSFSYYRKD